MKRQTRIGKYGFTMVEIMLVIVIFGIFVSATSVFNWTPQNDIEKVNRMKYAIADRLRDESLKISIGRMPMSDGIISTTTTMNFSTGAGIITSYADTGGTVFSTNTFWPPYYDGDTVYSITGITWWTGSTSSTTEWSGPWKIEITQDGIIFTGNTNITRKSIIVSIIVNYRNSTRRIQFDRRTGKISIDS